MASASVLVLPMKLRFAELTATHIPSARRVQLISFAWDLLGLFEAVIVVVWIDLHQMWQSTTVSSVSSGKPSIKSLNERFQSPSDSSFVPSLVAHAFEVDVAFNGLVGAISTFSEVGAHQATLANDSVGTGLQL